MAGSTDPDAVDKTDVAVENSDKTKTIKPEVDEAVRKENERLKSVVQSLQKSKDDFEKFKAEQEKAKLSDSERIRLEIEEGKQARAAAEARALQAEQKLETQKLVNELVAEHGLTNPEFGEVIVKKFDADKEDFETFAKRMAADKKYSAAFGTQQVSGTISATRPTAPPGPASSTSRRTVGVQEEDQAAADREWARELFQGDPEKQKAVLTRLAAERAASKK